MSKKLKSYLLDNIDVLKDIVSELNGYSGCLDFLDYMPNDEDFFNNYFTNTDDAVRAVCYGDYNYMDEYVRFNAYGNLESFNSWQLEDDLKNYIDEIIDNLINYKDDIFIYDDELKNILESE